MWWPTRVVRGEFPSTSGWETWIIRTLSRASSLGLPGSAEAIWATAGRRRGICRVARRLRPGLSRVFRQRGRALVILLCGGDKRTQERDIRRAKQYWQDYQQRE